MLNPPSKLYPTFYRGLQRAGAVTNMKAVADALPKASPSVIEAAFEDDRPDTPDAWHAFVARWFDPPPSPAYFTPAPQSSMVEHIDRLWDHLARRPAPQPAGSSLVVLSQDYIIPGGIFRECYYWDSYFTIIGLDERRADLRAACVASLAEQIDRFGHVPNGNRTYYLSRSQPPTFYLSVAALSPETPERAWADHLEPLLREHGYWMAGSDALAPGEASRCAVRLSDGSLLNRYWDDLGEPRDEASSGRDIRIAAAAPDRAEAEVYRDIRAGCASGWDFSSRWLADRRSMHLVRTTDIVPIDLNALLFGLEQAIARGAIWAGRDDIAQAFEAKAVLRRRAIERWLWNEAIGLFDDLSITSQQPRGAISAAALLPLFVGLASTRQAEATAAVVMRKLLAGGGVLSTNIVTGEQWDAPNGWAPCQWFAVVGLERYGLSDLAGEIARRWLRTVSQVFAETGRMMEKYDVVRERPGGGGKYPLQDGFGWTNGVTAALLRRFPLLRHYGHARHVASTEVEAASATAEPAVSGT